LLEQAREELHKLLS
jgi:hypothetical protein